jgi:hypothetical protein
MSEEQDRFINCIKQYNNILINYIKTITDLQNEVIQLTNLLEEKYNEVVEDDLPF